VMSISSHPGRMALLQHWLWIGVRSGNCGLLGNVLLLAHKCSVSLSDMNLIIARPLPAITPVVLPRYIDEWIDDPRRICCARSQVHGAVSWRPNAPFVAHVGDEKTLRAQLASAHPGIEDQVDYLICTAEIFLATPLHEEDQKALARLNGLLWSKLEASTVGGSSAEGMRYAEVTAPIAVRCRLGGVGYTVCTLSGRTAVAADSCAVHSVFSLTPHFATEGPSAASATPVAVALPVGLPSWPINELSAAASSAITANAGGDGAMMVGYDLLDDLGLELEPDDAIDMMQAPDISESTGQ